MSSTLLYDLWQSIWLNNCAAVVLVTTVTYDTLLTFSREVDYVWLKPWTCVSSLFLVIRYLGLCLVFLYGFSSSSAFSASVIVFSEGTIFYLVLQWTLLLYNVAVDLVMILRIYAMWNRSKTILCLLLCVFVPETIIAFVFAGVNDDPNTYMSVTTSQVLDITVCDISYNLPSPFWAYITPTFFFAAVLLILPIIQILRQSIDMYRATKTWQPNRYMKLLVSDGIIYFLVRSTYDIRTVVAYGTDTVSYKLTLAMSTGTFILLFSMFPRFIIKIRELYDGDYHRQWHGVDTGFGVFSCLPAVVEDAMVSGIALADSPLRCETRDVKELAVNVEMKPCEVNRGDMDRL